MTFKAFMSAIIKMRTYKQVCIMCCRQSFGMAHSAAAMSPHIGLSIGRRIMLYDNMIHEIITIKHAIFMTILNAEIRKYKPLQ